MKLSIHGEAGTLSFLRNTMTFKRLSLAYVPCRFFWERFRKHIHTFRMEPLQNTTNVGYQIQQS